MNTQSGEASFLLDDQQLIVEWAGGTLKSLGASDSVVGRHCYEIVRGRDPFGQPFCGPDCPAFSALKSGRLSDTHLLRTKRGKSKAWLRCNLIALPRVPGGSIA